MFFPVYLNLLVEKHVEKALSRNLEKLKCPPEPFLETREGLSFYLVGLSLENWFVVYNPETELLKGKYLIQGASRYQPVPFVGLFVPFLPPVMGRRSTSCQFTVFPIIKLTIKYP